MLEETYNFLYNEIRQVKRAAHGGRGIIPSVLELLSSHVIHGQPC
jgi:hypothetical protein